MIYLIGNKQMKICKIGFTEGDVKSRLASLQTGCHFRLEVLGLLTGGRKEERLFHGVFDAYRELGEWFKYNEHIQKLFNEPPDGMERLMEQEDHNEEAPLMMFHDAEQAFFKIRRGADMKVFFILAFTSEYNTGKVRLDTEGRKRLYVELGIISSNLSASLKRLREIGMLITDDESTRINPLYFWRGDLETRRRLVVRTQRIKENIFNQ